MCKYTGIPYSPQVNGHLDYMRQMETILVAVGVRTRERAGVPTVPSPECTEEGRDPGRDRSVEGGGFSGDERVEPGDKGGGGGVAEENPACDADASDIARLGEESERGEEKEGAKEGCAVEGWDIPDISDLLDSLNDADIPSPHCLLGSSVDGPGQSVISKNVGLIPEPQGGAEGVEGTDWDSQHTHWDWDTTNWTTEHSHTETGHGQTQLQFPLRPAGCRITTVR